MLEDEVELFDDVFGLAGVDGVRVDGVRLEEVREVELDG